MDNRTNSVALDKPYKRPKTEIGEKCSVCRAASAANFCFCAFPVVFLCENCAKSHVETVFNDIHCFFDLSSVRVVQSEGDCMRAKCRFLCLKSAEKRLLANLEEVTNCEQELLTLCEAIVNKVKSGCESRIAELRSIKAKLETDIAKAVQQAKSQLFSRDTSPDSDIDRLLSNYSSDPLKMTLFRFQVQEKVTANDIFQQLVGVSWTTGGKSEEKLETTLKIVTKTEDLPQIEFVTAGLSPVSRSVPETKVFRSPKPNLDKSAIPKFHCSRRQVSEKRCEYCQRLLPSSELGGYCGDECRVKDSAFCRVGK